MDNYFCSVIFITHVLYTTVGCALRASSLTAPPPIRCARCARRRSAVRRCAALPCRRRCAPAPLLSPALRAGSRLTARRLRRLAINSATLLRRSLLTAHAVSGSWSAELCCCTALRGAW